jgi:hypothetical protein
MTPTPQSRGGFDWPIYADATFAGLAMLIPIPLLDWVVERFFRRRMVATIAGRRGQRLPRAIRTQLNQGNQSRLSGCLTFPLVATIWLIKRISRKILYLLTIKDATDQLSYYWQRAFLIDHMLDAGHMRTETSAAMAGQAMEQVLQTSASPLPQLARQVISGIRHVPRMLWSARRGREDESIRQTEARMSQNWNNFQDYFASLAARYDQTFAEMSARGP